LYALSEPFAMRHDIAPQVGRRVRVRARPTGPRRLRLVIRSRGSYRDPPARLVTRALLSPPKAGSGAVRRHGVVDGTLNLGAAFLFTARDGSRVKITTLWTPSCDLLSCRVRTSVSRGTDDFPAQLHDRRRQKRLGHQFFGVTGTGGASHPLPERESGTASTLCNEAQAPTAQMAVTPPSIRKSA